MASVITPGRALDQIPSRSEWEKFAGVDTWIFDLDDTLYPRSAGLHRQLKGRVVQFIADLMKLDNAQAEAIHYDYYERYGATLQGLVELHDVAPAAFLEFVHAIDLSPLRHDAGLADSLLALPGRRVVLTNSSRSHATAVLAALGMSHLFDSIYSIEDCNFVGKPQQSAYAGFLAAHGIDPRTSAMFDDRIGNLVVPHDLGMRTALIVDSASLAGSHHEMPDHVDVVVPDLPDFLSGLAKSAKG